eukprot:403371824
MQNEIDNENQEQLPLIEKNSSISTDNIKQKQDIENKQQKLTYKYDVEDYENYYEKLSKEELIDVVKVMENDLFKVRAENMKLQTKLKETEQKSILNKKNSNNTTSAFGLPSEFKKQWDELMSENLIDAFGVHGKIIFKYDSNALIDQFFRDIQKTQNYSQYLEELDESDLTNYFKQLHQICLHMIMSDPPINLELDFICNLIEEQQKQLKNFYQNTQVKNFKSKQYYCADGFPKEDDECIVIIKSPMREQHIYQGIKPTVLIFDKQQLDELQRQDDEMLKDSKMSVVLELPRKSDDIPQQYPRDINQDLSPNQVIPFNIDDYQANITQFKNDQIYEEVQTVTLHNKDMQKFVELNNSQRMDQRSHSQINLKSLCQSLSQSTDSIKSSLLMKELEIRNPLSFIENMKINDYEIIQSTKSQHKSGRIVNKYKKPAKPQQNILQRVKINAAKEQNKIKSNQFSIKAYEGKNSQRSRSRPSKKYIDQIKENSQNNSIVQNNEKKIDYINSIQSGAQQLYKNWKKQQNTTTQQQQHYNNNYIDDSLHQKPTNQTFEMNEQNSICLDISSKERLVENQLYLWNDYNLRDDQYDQFQKATNNHDQNQSMQSELKYNGTSSKASFKRDILDSLNQQNETQTPSKKDFSNIDPDLKRLWDEVKRSSFGKNQKFQPLFLGRQNAVNSSQIYNQSSLRKSQLLNLSSIKLQPTQNQSGQKVKTNRNQSKFKSKLDCKSRDQTNIHEVNAQYINKDKQIIQQESKTPFSLDFQKELEEQEGNCIFISPGRNNQFRNTEQAEVISNVKSLDFIVNNLKNIECKSRGQVSSGQSELYKSASQSSLGYGKKNTYLKKSFSKLNLQPKALLIQDSFKGFNSNLGSQTNRVKFQQNSHNHPLTNKYQAIQNRESLLQSVSRMTLTTNHKDDKFKNQQSMIHDMKISSYQAAIQRNEEEIPKYKSSYILGQSIHQLSNWDNQCQTQKKAQQNTFLNGSINVKLNNKITSSKKSMF